MTKESLSFEQGPIRPPNEARSLLIRATRNCPWNKCAFCHTYQGEKFEFRSVEEIKKDILNVKNISEAIKEFSWKIGEGGSVTNRVFALLANQSEDFNHNYSSVAAWLYYGGQSVFLQDANSIIMKTDDLIEILSFIRETFPSVNRITSYCRSQTAAKKSLKELKSLKEAGLTRIHIGMETGHDALLKFIKKGTTAAQHIEGGRKIIEAGISLCEYVMPGLGGKKWSKEHAEETAKVINKINPDYVRLRTLHVVNGAELYNMMTRGEFEPLDEEGILREIRRFIECLNGIQTTIVSDHILNLIEELEGKLPEDKAYLLSIIDRYFSLSLEERCVFQLGRRSGIYRSLHDLNDRYVYLKLKEATARYDNDLQKLGKDLHSFKNHFI